MFNASMVYVEDLLKQVAELDVDYLRWVVWLIYPIIISFLLPLVLLVFLYASVLFLLVYRQRHRLRDAYAHDFWDGARKTLAALWDGQGRIWHGYEVVGLNQIPNTGPALIIYYHGVIPIDIYYIMAKLILEKGRQIHAVGDRFLFHIPGGVREALFGDEYYRIIWGKRTGFAKVALQAKVPVIPMFTENSREAFRTPGWGRSLLRKFYELTRLPIVPIYGFFPVKLRTHLGEPIYPKPDETPEMFASKVQKAVEGLVQQHQRLPGSVFKALLDRIPWKWKKS